MKKDVKVHAAMKVTTKDSTNKQERTILS